MRYTLVLCLSAMTLAATLASGSTFFVKPDGTGDAPTIQATVDTAASGDVIELDDGAFVGTGNREIDFHGKHLTLRSRSGHPEACVIDCAQAAPGFFFSPGDYSSSRLEGFTVANGGGGGAIRTYADLPPISNCIFSNCRADVCGGVACLYFAGAVFDHCVFVGNWSDEFGAIDVFYGHLRMADCVFQGNGSRWGGSALFLEGTSAASIERCTFSGNTDSDVIHVATDATLSASSCTIVGNSGSINFPTTLSATLGGSIRLSACIVAFNTGISSGAVGCDNTSSISAVCTDIYGNEEGDWVDCLEGQGAVDGNRNLDPRFCHPENGDFTLDSSSPCAPGYNPDCGLIGAWPVGCSSPPPVGACCLADATCRVTTASECGLQQGDYLGDGTVCVPNPCPPTATSVTSWGRIKVMYK
jgi:hypothetical protein